MQFKLFFSKRCPWQLPCATMLLATGLVGCSELSQPSYSSAGSHLALQQQSLPIIVVGGDPMIQQWTQEAASAFCEKKYWPMSLKKINHSQQANHLVFNQPKKTRVFVSKDDALHIDFKLGGVLMDNFSHELIIKPPLASMCDNPPLHYAVVMQPQGNAVIYISKPEKNNVVPAHVSDGSGSSSNESR
jgi:hypothetical protein